MAFMISFDKKSLSITFLNLYKSQNRETVTLQHILVQEDLTNFFLTLNLAGEVRRLEAIAISWGLIFRVQSKSREAIALC